MTELLLSLAYTVFVACVLLYRIEIMNKELKHLPECVIQLQEIELARLDRKSFMNGEL